MKTIETFETIATDALVTATGGLNWQQAVPTTAPSSVGGLLGSMAGRPPGSTIYNPPPPTDVLSPSGLRLPPAGSVSGS